VPPAGPSLAVQSLDALEADAAARSRVARQALDAGGAARTDDATVALPSRVTLATRGARHAR